MDQAVMRLPCFARKLWKAVSQRSIFCFASTIVCLLLFACTWHPTVYATKPIATASNNNAPHTHPVALTFGGTGMPAPKAEAIVDDTLTTATQHFTLARPQQKAHELVRRECAVESSESLSFESTVLLNRMFGWSARSASRCLSFVASQMLYRAHFALEIRLLFFLSPIWRHLQLTLSPIICI
jgi:hypothetical protein